MGSTRLDLPVAWLGSTTTGRWVFSWMMGTADRSRVLRVYFSKVRMPRSQRMTFSLPPAMIYSALMIHSSMVVHRPRLSRTGLCMKRGLCNTIEEWIMSAQAPLEQNGLVHLAHRLEQLEVLHIARADLDHVHIFLELGDAV